MREEPSEMPTVPDSVLAYLHAYGDSRADDDGLSGLRIGELILALRRWAKSIAAPTTQEAPRQSAQEPCPTCVALARTVMLDQVSIDRKPDCYGIRQITDDEGVEEWEDIRTSPDVAREEANDMMATGRGEIYEVVPLYTAPQPAPVAQGDALPREDFAWMVVQEACETEPADEDDPECIRILRIDLKSAVLAAFLRLDAARAQAKEGGA